MSTPDEDYALLLEGPSLVDAELAKELLGQAGIPVLETGADLGDTILGRIAHDEHDRNNLYVPKDLLVRAQQILAEAWEDR